MSMRRRVQCTTSASATSRELLMEPEENALLRCLAQTISSVPCRQWTRSDRLCVQKHLEEAASTARGGLSEAGRTAARRIFAALVEVDTSTPSFPHLCLFESQNTPDGVRISAQDPTVTVAKCLSFSILSLSRYKCGQTGTCCDEVMETGSDGSTLDSLLSLSAPISPSLSLALPLPSLAFTPLAPPPSSSHAFRLSTSLPALSVATPINSLPPGGRYSSTPLGPPHTSLPHSPATPGSLENSVQDTAPNTQTDDETEQEFVFVEETAVPGVVKCATGSYSYSRSMLLSLRDTDSNSMPDFPISAWIMGIIKTPPELGLDTPPCTPDKQLNFSAIDAHFNRISVQKQVSPAHDSTSPPPPTSPTSAALVRRPRGPSKGGSWRPRSASHPQGKSGWSRTPPPITASSSEGNFKWRECPSKTE